MRKIRATPLVCVKCGEPLTYLFEYKGVHKPFMAYGCKKCKTIEGTT